MKVVVVGVPAVVVPEGAGHAVGTVGSAVGFTVGFAVGDAAVGSAVGDAVGFTVGACVGVTLHVWPVHGERQPVQYSDSLSRIHRSTLWGFVSSEHTLRLDR